MHCGHCGSQLAPQAVVCVTCGGMPRVGRRFCLNCGKENANPQAVVCVHCGAALGGGMMPPPPPQPGMTNDYVYPSTPARDPVLMGVLSGCLLAGIGQIILGQQNKGLVMLIVSVVVGLGSGLILAPVLWVIAGIDAYLIAQKLQRGIPVRQWDFF
ncbi:MAG TPA: zinc ribbon domain-containing protein [Thermoanaerobaculia bacterium]